MYTTRLLLLFLITTLTHISTHAHQDPNPQKRIVIVIAGYNNIAWYEKNLDSVFSQDYDNYHVIYMDDGSIDGTHEAVRHYIEEHNVHEKITLIHNETRVGSSLRNRHYAVNLCNDNDIIACLDADDWFPNDQVLSILNRTYNNPDIWLTYGQFQEYPSGTIGWSTPIPDSVMRNNSFRSIPNMPSHLKTFYAGLFKKINLEDMLDTDGSFYRMTDDMVMMLPMLEMAGNGHFMCISEILYVYNGANPISDHRVSKELQQRIDRIMRNKKSYTALTTLF